MGTAEQTQAAALLEQRRRMSSRYTVVGLVCPTDGHTHSLSNKTGSWAASKEPPTCYLAKKLEPVLTSKKRYIVIYGGRGSSKSIGGHNICIFDAKDNGIKTYCLREYQSSIESSVYSLIKAEIERLEFSGFEVLSNTIKYNGNDVFKFAGLSRNISSIKSSHGFGRYIVEEAEFLSDDSIQKFTPTARNKARAGLPLTADQIKKLDDDDDLDGVSMMFILNPQSSEDPVCKRFIVPYQSELDANGIYEDDTHLIIKINYTDNPWFLESGLEVDRLWWFNNASRSLYDHIWLGYYNDRVENSIIQGEWFDACVDAHIKLGFEAKGAKIAAHDVSDTGPDTKGYAMRHGVVFQRIEEKTDGDGNEGGHWAAGLAQQDGVEHFTWDCDGMGALLNEQMADDFKQSNVNLVQFKGSQTPDNPDALFEPTDKHPIKNQLKVKDAVKNKRAQYYAELRRRCYKTYLAVIHGQYIDPDELVGFSSDIALLSKLRSELCRMPIKPNGAGKIELYTKDDMKSKFKFPSPNLADSVMMAMRYMQTKKTETWMPRPIPTIGNR